MSFIVGLSWWTLCWGTSGSMSLFSSFLLGGQMPKEFFSDLLSGGQRSGASVVEAESGKKLGEGGHKLVPCPQTLCSTLLREEASRLPALMEKRADAQHCRVLLKVPTFQQPPDSEFQGSHHSQPLSLFSGIGSFLSFCPFGLGFSSLGAVRFQVPLVHLLPSSPLPSVLQQYLLLSSLSL